MGDGRPLNLNLLRIFVKVYETGHVTRAAEELGMSQPAVSAGLTRLAGHYGQPLFQRTKNGIAPTRLADKPFATRRFPTIRSVTFAYRCRTWPSRRSSRPS